MPEDEVETGQDVETAKAEQQPVEEPAVKKPKAVKAAASKSSATAEVKGEKAAAIDEIMATIKNMTVLELSYQSWSKRWRLSLGLVPLLRW